MAWSGVALCCLMAAVMCFGQGAFVASDAVLMQGLPRLLVEEVDLFLACHGLFRQSDVELVPRGVCSGVNVIDEVLGVLLALVLWLRMSEKARNVVDELSSNFCIPWWWEVYGCCACPLLSPAALVRSGCFGLMGTCLGRPTPPDELVSCC